MLLYVLLFIFTWYSSKVTAFFLLEVLPFISGCIVIQCQPIALKCGILEGVTRDLFGGWVTGSGGSHFFLMLGLNDPGDQ